MTTTRTPVTSPGPRAPSVPEAAHGQGGVFTRQQALDEGWTPRQVRRRTESGTWRRLAGKALVHRTLQPDALAWAWAVGVTWPDAVVSHRTAALLHGFPMPPTPEGRPEEAHSHPGDDGARSGSARTSSPSARTTSASSTTWPSPRPGAPRSTA